MIYIVKNKNIRIRVYHDMTWILLIKRSRGKICPFSVIVETIHLYTIVICVQLVSKRRNKREEENEKGEERPCKITYTRAEFENASFPFPFCRQTR